MTTSTEQKYFKAWLFPAFPDASELLTDNYFNLKKFVEMDCNYHALKNKRHLGFTCYTLIKPGQLQVPFPAKKCLKKKKSLYYKSQCRKTNTEHR